MLTMPGMQAMHAIVSDECRKGRGDDGVIDEVVRRLSESMRATLKGWDLGRGVKIHVGMTVERPDGIGS
jgi:hypothetical protein